MAKSRSDFQFDILRINITPAQYKEYLIPQYAPRLPPGISRIEVQCLVPNPPPPAKKFVEQGQRYTVCVVADVTFLAKKGRTARVFSNNPYESQEASFRGLVEISLPNFFTVRYERSLTAENTDEVAEYLSGEIDYDTMVDYLLQQGPF